MQKAHTMQNFSPNLMFLMKLLVMIQSNLVPPDLLKRIPSHLCLTQQAILKTEAVFNFFSILIKVKKQFSWQDAVPITALSPTAYTILKVRIYQYPLGHPLQKVSTEFADFRTGTHQSVTLPGSSGSALQNFQTTEIVGIYCVGY